MAVIGDNEKLFTPKAPICFSIRMANDVERKMCVEDILGAEGSSISHCIENAYFPPFCVLLKSRSS